MKHFASGTKAILWWAAFAVLLEAILVLLWFFNRDAYIYLGIEDALGENVTALCYVAAAVLIWTAGIKAIRSGSSSVLRESLPLLLGALFLWIGGEEVSWGQRLFGFGTPEAMKASNLQNEFNFHNLSIFDKDEMADYQQLVENYRMNPVDTPSSPDEGKTKRKKKKKK